MSLGELRELYQEVILDHGRHPRNLRRIADANREARGSNPLCGDRFTVYLKVNDDGIIEDASFEGRGCAISTASASMMTEVLRGKTAEQARALFDAFHSMCTEDAEAEAGPELADETERLQVLAGVRGYPMRVKCATLAWHAMSAAMAGEKEVSTET
jgi:nitrogen fixation NifU-like protein